MVFARFGKPKVVEVKVLLHREMYDLLEDLKRFYRLPLNDLIEALISADHEAVVLRASLNRKSLSSVSE
jgi:hypothetical protein